MKLTRNQADLALRHYTAEYAAKANEDFVDERQFASFVRELQWRIDADLTRNHIAWLVKAWQEFGSAQFGDATINFEVNDTLDNANFPGPHILRYSEQAAA